MYIVKNDYNKIMVDRLITERRDTMSHTESFKEFYKRCKEMDIEKKVEVALNAELEEEQESVELISNFMVQESLRNLRKEIEMCDFVSINDNTETMLRFAIYGNGRLCLVSRNDPDCF